MANKKNDNKKVTKASTSKKATAKKSPLSFSQTEIDKMAKQTEKEMRRLGFNNVDEYIKYIDKKRGY
ncbi:MAG: hypothetical protein IJH64_00435 [Oscillospiraceae bacterium]|nr:hypothetical protein [Oscillospiraceae bacterium]